MSGKHIHIMSIICQIVFGVLMFSKIVASNVEPTNDEEIQASDMSSLLGISNENASYQHEHDMRIELDVLLTEEQMRELQNSEREKRSAISFERYRWKDGVVPYSISRAFGLIEKNVILDALKSWEKVTCLHFIERNSTTKTYVDIVRGRGGCYSYIGCIGGKQELGLGRGCVLKRTVIHELGHAIGLFHHHSRPDRDEFVKILFENIKKSRARHFSEQKFGIHTFGTKYDYRSIMHYGKKYFSKNGKITIRTIDPKYQDIIGRAPYMSFRDAKVVNAMYACVQDAKCPTTTCPGDGYRGTDCQCYCPQNDGVDIMVCQTTDTATKAAVSQATESTTIYIQTTIRDCSEQEKPNVGLCGLNNVNIVTYRPNWPGNSSNPPATQKTTKKPTTPAAVTVGCRNSWSLWRCGWQARRGWCNRNPKVTRNCKMTCKSCNDSVCRNVWDNKTCNVLRIYCNSLIILTKKCKRTCGRCGAIS